MKPMQLSLKKLRNEGWNVYITEKYNYHAKRRIDAYGFGDILGINTALVPEMQGATLFQTTTLEHFSERKNKILENENSKDWLECGNRICIHGWGTKREKGALKREPICKEEWFCKGDI